MFDSNNCKVTLNDNAKGTRGVVAMPFARAEPTSRTVDFGVNCLMKKQVNGMSLAVAMEL